MLLPANFRKLLYQCLPDGGDFPKECQLLLDVDNDAFPTVRPVPQKLRFCGNPISFYMLGGSEFRLRQGFVQRTKRLHAPFGAPHL